MSPDVIVVGGGAIGTAITYRLAKAGVRVTLLERGAIGGEATGASAGMIAPHWNRDTPEAFAVLCQESARLYPALAAELRERTGMDIGYRAATELVVAFDEAEELELHRQRAWQADRGTNVLWLDRSSALDLEPSLHPSVRGAIAYPDHHQLLPTELARTQGRAAADLGAVIREGVAVTHLQTSGDRVVGVGVGSESLLAPEVVLATGCWSAGWGQHLGVSIPVRPMRGQMVALQTPGTALRCVIGGAGGYAITKPDGRTIVGTTVEDAGFDSRPTVEGITGLLARAPKLAPKLATAAVVAVWAGLRPGTPDGLPIIGRAGTWQGITLATGHFRNGILLAAITGELVTDLLLRRTPRLDLAAFEPGRFLIRAA